MCSRRCWPGCSGSETSGKLQAVSVDQRAKRRHWPCVAQSGLLLEVKIYHLHAERFGNQANLGADVSVSYYAQDLPAHFVGRRGGFDPAATMGHGVAVGDASHEQNR